MSVILRRARPLSWALAASGRSAGYGTGQAQRHLGTVNVILREDLEGRGYKGEEITVKGGYMRNFLFPAQKAVYATEENRAVYQSVQKTEDSEKIDALKALKRGRSTLSKVPIIFKRHVERPGAPTREVTAQNVSDFLLKNRRLQIPAENIEMKSITSLGVHDIRIQVGFTDEIKDVLREELGASEFDEQSWVDTTLRVIKR